MSGAPRAPGRRHRRGPPPSESTEWAQQSVSTTYVLHAGDSVKQIVEQRSGGPLTVQDDTRTNFSVVWLGPAS